VHPLTIIKPARTSRKMNNKPEVFPAMVPDIIGYKIYVQGHERIVSATDLFFYYNPGVVTSHPLLLTRNNGKDFFIIVKVKR
jgi:hypothetical protein